MKKNAQIFLVVVGVVILFLCAQSAAARRPCPLLKVNKLRRRPAAQMGVAKSDFSQMRRSRSHLIKNVEHFARIELDYGW